MKKKTVKEQALEFDAKYKAIEAETAGLKKRLKDALGEAGRLRRRVDKLFKEGSSFRYVKSENALSGRAGAKLEKSLGNLSRQFLAFDYLKRGRDLL